MSTATEEPMPIEKNPFEHILYEMSMYIKTYRFTVGNQTFTNLVRANHSVHLRNLTYFFKSGTTGNNDWHYSEFVKDKNTITPLSEKQFSKFKGYCCGAVDHLNSNRMNDDYKKKTKESEAEAFPVIVRMIQEFLDTLDDNVNQDNEEYWYDPRIQRRAENLRELCTLHSAGGGCVLSGSCEVIQVPADRETLPRFFNLGAF